MTKRVCKKALVKLFKETNINREKFLNLLSYPEYLTDSPDEKEMKNDCLACFAYIKDNSEEIKKAIEKLDSKRACKKDFYQCVRTHTLFDEVYLKDMKNHRVLEPLFEENFQLILSEASTVMSSILNNEEYFMQEYKRKMYQELLIEKYVWYEYPKYIDKRTMDSRAKEVLKAALETGKLEIELELSDIYKEFKYYSEEREKEIQIENRVLRAKASIENIENYYYKARAQKRHIIAHFGPTNSGKTYQAIQKFKNSKTGIYLAPLRLLAREIYDDCKDELPISLVTGEEVIEKADNTHVSSTVEMADLSREYSIAIIDEIQMIEDDQRGAAWSRALMGVNADIVIVIGSENSKEIVEKIAEKCGDTLEIVPHKRLSPLYIEDKPVRLSELRKGDAIVCFSRREIYRLKEQVENFGKTVAVVYGALPPSTRLIQAEQFNKGEKDILIATDAIGYGINLNIERIVFSAVTKYNGVEEIQLPDALFKQIAGRAGRYNKTDFGKVCFLQEHFGREGYEEEYLDFLAYCDRLNQPLKSIEHGIFFPESSHIIEFSHAKEYNNSLARLIEDYDKFFIDKSGLFKMNDIYDFHSNALIIDSNDCQTGESFALDLETKQLLAFAPRNQKSKEATEIFNMFINFFRSDTLDEIKDFSEYYSIRQLNGYDLNELEGLNKDLSLYLWLSYRAEVSESKIGVLMSLYEKVSMLINKKIEYPFEKS